MCKLPDKIHDELFERLEDWRREADRIYVELIETAIARISAAGINTKNYDAFGVVVGGQISGSAAGLGVTVTLLGERDNPSKREAFVSIEGGLGGFFGRPARKLA